MDHSSLQSGLSPTMGSTLNRENKQLFDRLDQLAQAEAQADAVYQAEKKLIIQRHGYLKVYLAERELVAQWKRENGHQCSKETSRHHSLDFYLENR